VGVRAHAATKPHRPHPPSLPLSLPNPNPSTPHPSSFESVNFLEFVKLLAPFTGRVSEEDKLQFLFTVFDVDGDGGLTVLVAAVD
jgi:hypothetical protein